MTDLYPHQEAALQKLSNGKILWGGVGSGKTKVAVEYYMRRERPRAVYVITTAKKRDDFDWQQEFYERGIGPASGPEWPGGDKKAKGRSARPADPQAGRVHGAEASGAHGRRGSESASGLLLEGDRYAIDIAGIDARLGRDGALLYQAAPDDVLSGRDADSSGIQFPLSDKGDLNRGVSGNARSLPGIPGVYPWVVTVDSWNNIAKYADVSGAFFIFDEQRLVGSGDWTRKFLRISKRNRWILLTATPGDTWSDYIPVFVANGFYKNRTQVKTEHFVYNSFSKFPKVERYINVQKLYRHRKELLVEMKYDRHTKRRHVEVPLPYDKKLLETVIKDRWNVFEDRPLRDVAELCTVSRRVVNGDPSRLEMVCELWKAHPKLIVFYNYNFELMSLRSLTEYYGIGPARSSSTLSSDGSDESSLSSRSTSGTISTDSSRNGSSNAFRREREAPSSGISLPGRGTTSTADSPKTSDGETWTTISNSPSPRILTEARLSESPPSTRTSGVVTYRQKTSLPTTFGDSEFSGRTPSGTRSFSERVRESLEGSSTIATTPTSMLNKQPSMHTTDALGDGSKWAEDPASSTSMSIAEWNGHKHQPIPQTERWLYLVQYTAGAEGWNCIETDAMVMYSANYSWKVTEQAYGRIDRLNTPFTDLWYYGFTSDSWIDRAIARALREKGNFNENKYAGLFKGSE